MSEQDLHFRIICMQIRKKDKLLEQMEAFVDNIGEIKEKIEMELTLDNVMEYKKYSKIIFEFLR